MLKRLLNKFQFTEKFFLIAIIAAGILAFGLQIPSLGFYQDDWHFIRYGTAGARGMFEFLIVDGRPSATWVYAIAYPLIGFAPIRWQIVSLALRLTTAFLFWLVLNKLWRGHTRTNLAATFFFLLYPAFTLQAQAVVYAEHWTAYALLMFSLWSMIGASENPKRYLFSSTFAILATTLSLFTVEYFVGLEVLRPLILFLTISKITPEATIQTRLKRALTMWMPYAVILILFLYWRSAIIGAMRFDLSESFSIQTIISMSQHIGADSALILIAAWFRLIDPFALELDRLRNIIVVAVSIISGLITFQYTRSVLGAEDRSPRWNTFLLGGIIAFLLGLLPAYAVNFVIHQKLEPWNARFALAAMPGAALILAYAFDCIFTSARVRQVMFAILIGLLIGWGNRTAYVFRDAWEKQTLFYEQMIWRAPSLERGTAIITNEEILSLMGDYPTAFAINTIYESSSMRPEPYWFFAMSENLGADMDALTSGQTLDVTRYASTFKGNTRNSLIIHFLPENNQCLWTLRPEDASYRLLPAALQEAAQVSNIELIGNEPQNNFTLYKTIVPENKNAWCYFYQRADLARQFGEWKQITELWKQAEQGGFTPPGHGFEYIPFIQAFAHENDWAQAVELTKRSNYTSKNMKSILCPVWDEIESNTEPLPEKDLAVDKAKDLLGCQ
jgi:hypothetical protein